MGQFQHHHSGKTRTPALFWLRMSYHIQRYCANRSLLTQSFNIVNTPIILLFSIKWVPGLTAEDNIYFVIGINTTGKVLWPEQRVNNMNTLQGNNSPIVSCLMSTATMNFNWISYKPTKGTKYPKLQHALPACLLELGSNPTGGEFQWQCRWHIWPCLISDWFAGGLWTDTTYHSLGIQQ